MNHMNLSNIKQKYNAVFSLGQNCWPAWALYQLGLSPFFGVIDFMLSPSLESKFIITKSLSPFFRIRKFVLHLILG